MPMVYNRQCKEDLTDRFRTVGKDKDMKLKSIKKISSEVRYIIRVFEGKRFVEDFKIDYIDMTNDELREVLVNKYLKYENNRVRTINTETRNGKTYLGITIEL